MIKINARAIRVWLAEHDKTQEWLAQAAGLGAATVNRAMRGVGVPRESTVRLISEVTGIPVATLWHADTTAQAS
ncbi:MAG: hypothetical protein AMXMBFR33_01850 [Candidatus Xenobia bacterium]